MVFSTLGADNITHVIQLATAPVFLLTAVGTFLGVLANRLARITDRTRALDDLVVPPGTAASQALWDELHTLGQRLHLIYLAITLEVFCGLFVGLVIATAFFDALLTTNLTKVIAGLFVLAMIAFICGMVVFLREIFLAVGEVRKEATYRLGRDWPPGTRNAG